MALEHATAADWDEQVARRPGRVLVDFYAAWCPPCRVIAPLLERLAEEHAGRVVFLKVDVDAEEELAARFGVRTVPTLISFLDGREVERAVNPQSRALIEDLIAD